MDLWLHAGDARQARTEDVDGGEVAPRDALVDLLRGRPREVLHVIVRRHDHPAPR
jgi:hypothetical protein